MKGQLIGAPIMTAFIVFVGICGTSGSELAFGEAFWGSRILVSPLRQSRCGDHLLPVHHPGHPDHERSLQPGGRLRGVLLPLWQGAHLQKAVVVATILSICFLPWKLVENPESYVYTLNGTLAVFLGPITGICLAALWSQYRNRLRLPDLTTRTAAYYYQGGWNVLALVTMAVLFIFIFVCQFIPVLRWIYDSSYLLGCVFAFVILQRPVQRQDR